MLSNPLTLKMEKKSLVMDYLTYWMDSSGGTQIFRIQTILLRHWAHLSAPQISSVMHKGPFLGDISCCIPKYTFF